MIRFRADSILRIFILTMGILFASRSTFAQSNDSLPQGVIKVRRAPVPSEYKVSVGYNYDTQHGFLRHFFSRKEGDAALVSPAEPALLDERNLNDSNQTLLDSSFIITFYNKQGKPAQEFDWEGYIAKYEHSFEWDDTAGIDSVLFVYEVNSRGQMKCTARETRDSSAMELQQALLPAMKRLWVWYPATKVNEEGRRQKRINCTVFVKVYAVKVGYGQNLPLKIVD